MILRGKTFEDVIKSRGLCFHKRMSILTEEVERSAPVPLCPSISSTHHVVTQQEGIICEAKNNPQETAEALILDFQPPAF